MAPSDITTRDSMKRTIKPGLGQGLEKMNIPACQMTDGTSIKIKQPTVNLTT